MRRSLASVLVCAFCALAAAGASAGDDGPGTAAGYKSRAGSVLGTYRPAPPDRLPETMARAAARFLDSLDEAQRRSAHHDLASPERRRWTNAPVRGKAGGVALGDLDGLQLRAFSDLLAALLSAKGYGKVRDVMLGDDLRATVDGEPNEGVGIGAFRFVVFGDPSTASRWAVQLDGHHVALNVTLDGDSYSLSPSFIGTYPQAFAVAGAKLRPLGAETDLAHELATSLTAEQPRAGGDRREARRAAGWTRPGRRRPGARRYPRQAAETGCRSTGSSPWPRSGSISCPRTTRGRARSGFSTASAKPGSPGAARWRPGATFPGPSRGRRSLWSMRRRAGWRRRRQSRGSRPHGVPGPGPRLWRRDR